MRSMHAGLGASSERNADVFFHELLGLSKHGPAVLPAELCRGVFGINRELTVFNYKAEGIHYEVFIDPAFRGGVPTVVHTCLEVDGLEEFLKRCAEKRICVSRTPKGDSFVIFISDLDGNLYEIKERKASGSPP